jgi:hypothetical protein
MYSIARDRRHDDQLSLATGQSQSVIALDQGTQPAYRARWCRDRQHATPTSEADFVGLPICIRNLEASQEQAPIEPDDFVAPEVVASFA